MKKRSLFSLITSACFLSIVPFFLVSCSDNKILKISGGIKEINGYSTDHDDHFWYANLNNKNYSKNSAWSIINSSISANLIYDENKQGVFLSWQDIPFGNYQFYVQAKGNIDGKDLTFVSELVTLHVNQTYNAIGGSNSIVAQPNSSDKKGWKALDNGTDYSSLCVWSVEPVNDKISIQYDRDICGAVVSWKDLKADSYSFTIKGIFSSENGTKKCFVSNLIKLEIIEEGYCAGGSTYIESCDNSSDKKAWHFDYDGKDVSADGTWSIQPNIEGIRIYYNKQLGGAVVSWDALNHSITYNFKVTCSYKTKSGGSVIGSSDNITLKLLEKVDVTGGSIEITGQNTGADTKPWVCRYLGENYSETATWSTNPVIDGLKIEYDVSRQGAILRWDKIAFGLYTFKITCSFETPSHKKIVGESVNVILHIPETNLSGGAIYVNGLYSGGRDRNTWKAIYEGVDYSEKAIWTFQPPKATDSFIHFDENEHFIYWDNIGVDEKKWGDFKCLLSAEITTESGKTVGLTSGYITLNIRGVIDQVRGGPTSIFWPLLTTPEGEGWDRYSWQPTFEGILYTSGIRAGYEIFKDSSHVYEGTIRVKYNEKDKGYNLGWADLNFPDSWDVCLTFQIKTEQGIVQVYTPIINLYK